MENGCENLCRLFCDVDDVTYGGLKKDVYKRQAGYIATFLFLFARLNQPKGYENLLADIALNCRPLLYSLILYILLKSEDVYKRQDV